MLGASLAQYLVAETLGYLLIEDAVFLEYSKSIGIQHLRPFVAVIPSRIAARHDVRKLHRHTRVGQLFAKDGFLPDFLLEGDDVVREFVLLRIVCHIQQSERYLTQTGRCRHEVTALDDAVDELVGQRFACLIVEGERAQEIFFDSEILHKLRRQFHEIPPDICATETLETRIGKHAVQRVAKLMQESLHLTQGQQCGFVLRRFRQVHHHRDVWTDVFTFSVDILSLIFRHPRTALLAFARMEVGIEHSEERAVLIEHLVSLDVRMIDGNVLVLLECDAIQLIGQSEDTVNHPLQFEIRTQHLGIDVVLLHLQLVRIEARVPRLHLVYIFMSQFAQFVALLDGCGHVGVNQVVQQPIDAAGVRGHATFQHVVGIGLIA